MPGSCASTYDLEGEDPQLLELVSSVRTGIKRGMWNGVAKEVMRNVISLVQQHGLCAEHNLRLFVSSPSSSTKCGGKLGNWRVPALDCSFVLLHGGKLALPPRHCQASLMLWLSLRMNPICSFPLGRARRKRERERLAGG